MAYIYMGNKTEGRKTVGRLAVRFLEGLESRGPEEIRSLLSAGGWRFRGYTPHLPVVPGGRILIYAAKGRRCYVFYDPETQEFMLQILPAE